MPGRAFRDLLLEARKAAVLSQRELADAAGLSEQAVSALERGRRLRPHPSTVRRLACALDLEGERFTAFVHASQAADLDGEEDDQPPEPPRRNSAGRA